MRIESAAWKVLRPFLIGARLDPVRVENPIHPGTPDVNLVNGAWLELKAIASYPRRAATVVRIPHFTPQQRAWLLRRLQYGGRSYLVLHVVATREWLLFNALEAGKRVGRVPREELRACAERIVLDPFHIVEAVR
jgi:hypothetical protein